MAYVLKEALTRPSARARRLPGACHLQVGTQFTGFTSTKVLTLQAPCTSSSCSWHPFTGFTGTKAQILTLQAPAQARVAKSIGAVHQQQLQLAQVLARVRAEEADIVSRVSMLQIEHSKPFPANADHTPTLGEHARAGAPVHEPEPVIPLAVVRRIQASREEYVRSLQVLSLLALLVQQYN